MEENLETEIQKKPADHIEADLQNLTRYLQETEIPEWQQRYIAYEQDETLKAQLEGPIHAQRIKNPNYEQQHRHDTERRILLYAGLKTWYAGLKRPEK